MTRYLAITTCNAAQWIKYGRCMVTTFRRHWPPDVPLRVYTEGFNCSVEGVQELDLGSAAPWLEPWKAVRTKADHGRVGSRYSFRRDAVRFAHKIAAIGAAAEDDAVDVLIWMDADTVTHSPVTVGWIEELFPEPSAVAWLDRERVYPECGFLMFRLPGARPVIREIVRAYQTGAIFRLAETHDSYVIDRFVREAVTRGEIEVASLSGEARTHHHVFVHSRLSERLDHLKGARKAIGRTPRHERLLVDDVEYWVA